MNLFHCLFAGRWGNPLSTQMRMSSNPGSTHRSVPLLLHKYQPVFTVYFIINLFHMSLDQPKPANTPTPPRPQGQPSPSIVVQQPVYGQTVCFPQMYPLTPVSPGVQVRSPLVLDDHLTGSQKVNSNDSITEHSWHDCFRLWPLFFKL